MVVDTSVDDALHEVLAETLFIGSQDAAMNDQVSVDHNEEPATRHLNLAYVL